MRGLTGTNYREAIAKDSAALQRKQMRQNATKARNDMLALGREVRSKLKSSAAICKTNRLTGREQAEGLRGEARQIIADANTWCTSRKANALYPGDAAQDCAAHRKRARASAARKRGEASQLQARVSEKCATRRRDIVAEAETELMAALDKLEDAMQTSRLYRDEERKKRTDARTQRSEKRSKFTEEFSAENAEFCKANLGQVRAEVKRAQKRGLRLDPHEACDELAERDKANWLATQAGRFETPEAIRQFEAEQEAYYRALTS